MIENKLFLDLFGMPYEVVFMDLASMQHEDQESWGMTDYDKHVIYIQDTVSIEAQRRTLMHEIMHVVVEESGMKYNPDALEKIEDRELRVHLMIEPLAIGIYEIFRDNENLQRFFFQESV